MVSDRRTVESKTNPCKKTQYASDSNFHSRFIFGSVETIFFSTAQYSKMLFIDVDVDVLWDFSTTFSYGNFCALSINSCYISREATVTTPNHTICTYLIYHVHTTPSYDVGDHGIWNIYFQTCWTLYYLMTQRKFYIQSVANYILDDLPFGGLCTIAQFSVSVILHSID